MKHGELTEEKLGECLQNVIKEWYENTKRGIETEKIIRASDGSFDILIGSYKKDQGILRVRYFIYGSLYQADMLLEYPMFDNYRGNFDFLIKSLQTELCKHLKDAKFEAYLNKREEALKND